jgi:hypothetical protein
MAYKLFLDDNRNPVHCITYMHLRIGLKNPIYLQNEWVIARNYESFKNTVEEMGLPEFVSFDHDLADEHYGKYGADLQSPEGWEEYHTDENREYTGYDCAKWLVNYCMDHKKSIPPFTVHSMNPIGTERIMNYLKNAEKWIKVGKT